jgi:hypothetical protein
MPRTHHSEHHALRQWQRRRLERIDLLCTFLRIAVANAHTENDPLGWWSRHVAWAITRLERLDYRFPECDTPRTPGPRILTDIEVIAA